MRIDNVKVNKIHFRISDKDLKLGHVHRHVFSVGSSVFLSFYRYMQIINILPKNRQTDKERIS